MKRITFVVVALCLISTPAFSKKEKKNSSKKEDVAVVAQQAPVDSVSYVLGLNVAGSLKNLPVVLDVESFVKGIKDMQAGTATMTEEESVAFLQSYFMGAKNRAAQENTRKGEEFLANNKQQEGVVTLESGLQYKILREGAGIVPTEESEVEVNYRGTLIDGREFDSSYARGESISFPLNRVIKGWTEGLQHVKEGGKIQLFIPSNLAYGDREMQGSIIEPGSTLIFEVELIKVK